MKPCKALLPVLAVTALGLAGCGDATVAGDQVVLDVGDLRGGSQALLGAAGQLGGTSYKIEWSTFTSGPLLLEAADAGAVDIGSVGNTPPIFSAAANAKVAVVQASQHTGPGDAILVPGDSSIHDPQELRGKTIAVTQGSSGHGQLLTVLNKYGIPVSDVKIDYLQPSDAYAAFTGHRVDAWATWDPYTSQALIQAHARSLISGSGGTANGYSFQVASRTALADPTKSAAIKDYLSRLATAQRWSNSHRAQWASAWSKVTGLDPVVAKASVDDGAALPIPLDDKVIASEQQLADAFTSAKLLPGRITFANVVDRRFESTRNSR